MGSGNKKAIGLSSKAFPSRRFSDLLRSLAMFSPTLWRLLAARHSATGDDGMTRPATTNAPIVKTMVLAAAALVLGTGLAAAQSAKPQASIMVTNARGIMLTVFEIASTGDNPKLVGRIDKPLAPGKSVKVALKGAKGCEYYVLARFDDDSEANSEGMDLCREKTIRLTE
jgi:hypothetical protein